MSDFDLSYTMMFFCGAHPRCRYVRKDELYACSQPLICKRYNLSGSVIWLPSLAKTLRSKGKLTIIDRTSALRGSPVNPV